MHDVVRIACREVDRKFLRKAVKLWKEVWPDSISETEDEMLVSLWNRFVVDDTESSRTGIIHTVVEDDSVLAIAVSFEREVKFVEADQNALALALLGVCTSPPARGIGLGRSVVEDAFRRLSENKRLDFSLFQTMVPGFYRKMGGVVVENTFIDSTNEASPEANPWWDDFIIVQQGNGEWQKGLVDLRGKAY